MAAEASSIYILTRAKGEGGLGMLDLYRYYLVPILSQVKYWWQPVEDKQWFLMECTLLPQITPKLLMMVIGVGLTPSQPTPHMQLLSVLAPDLDLLPWTRAGIILLDHIYEGGKMKTFQALCADFGLPPTDFLGYMRVAKLLAQHDIVCPLG